MHYVPLDLCGKRCRDGRRNEDEVIKAYYVGTKQLVGLCYDLNQALFRGHTNQQKSEKGKQKFLGRLTNAK